MSEGLLSVSEARERLLAVLPVIKDIEEVKLPEALGRVLAVDLVADFDSPRFSNSSMDGFAILAQDSSRAGEDSAVILKVVADIPAGFPSDVKINAGEAARIMTGAQLPAGADCVIPVEDTNAGQNTAEMSDAVEIYRQLKSGDYIRPVGEDFKAGTILIKAGEEIGPQHLGVLAMCGAAEVQVFRRPRIALFSTGDEILPVSAALKPGKIRDTNSYTVGALLESAGAEVLTLGVAPDDPLIIKGVFARALAHNVDLIVTTAGVSVGAYDHLKSVVEEGGALNFWRVNMRPGKPLAFGEYEGVPYVGLPGNPVSSFVGTEVFLRPAIKKMAGALSWRRQTAMAVLAEDVETDGRETYFRAVLDFSKYPHQAYLAEHQGSGNLYSLIRANSLIVIPSGVKCFKAGEAVTAYLLEPATVKERV